MTSEDVFELTRSQIIPCNADVISGDKYEPVVCKLDASHNTTRRVRTPLTIDAEESDTCEFLWTAMSDCLLSETIVDELRSANIGGLDFEEVNIKGWQLVPIKYIRIRAIGWGGIAPEASGIRQTYRCPECLRMKYSPLIRPELLFDQRQWDGSDIFIIWPMSNSIFVTRKVVNLLSRLGVSGMELTPLPELKINRYGFSPDRLSSYLPKDYASKIGRAIGIE